MFTESAELYDAIYGSFKDYGREVEQIGELLHRVHPDARTVLDVACGTGEHLHRMSHTLGLEVSGLELDPAMLRIARAKHPGSEFFEGDMTDFHLGRRYDAVICLFSSIAYARTLDRVAQTFRCFVEHLQPDGVIVVEPWFAPGVLDLARITRNVATAGSLSVERVSHVEIDGDVARLCFDYEISGPDGTRHASEVHELGLFTREDMLLAFWDAGLKAEFDPVGLTGRGLYVARR